MIERGSGVLYYEDAPPPSVDPSEAPVAVLAHGAGGNAAIWWQQIPALRDAGYRVITFDHRGFGRSTAGTAELNEFPDDLLAILEREQIERFSLVCQSMGGWTGMQTALRVPERQTLRLPRFRRSEVWGTPIAVG